MFAEITRARKCENLIFLPSNGKNLQFEKMVSVVPKY